MKQLKASDGLCFYMTGRGVVAEATVASTPEHHVPDFVPDAQRFRWGFRVDAVRYFFDKPVLINAALRSHLEAFRGRDPNKAWSWFVQGARPITQNDFERLTGK